MNQNYLSSMNSCKGEINWTSNPHAVIVEGRNGHFKARELKKRETSLTTASVFRPKAVDYLQCKSERANFELERFPESTFLGLSRNDGIDTYAYVKTNRIRKIRAAHELVPAELALSFLSLWAKTDEERVGVYWSDGIQSMRVVTKKSSFWLYQEEDISQIEREIPWVDFSDANLPSDLDCRLRIIDGPCGFTGGAALAVGAAAAVTANCGGFVNPLPQSIMRQGVLTITHPQRQIST